MKLFQRIFATFCAVIICAIFVATFSFWLVQNSLAENHFRQQRTIEITLLNSVVSAFNIRGEQGIREIMSEWGGDPITNNIFVVTGDDLKDIFGRKVSARQIESAHNFAIENPDSNLVQVVYDRWGEEYLFFIRDWNNQQIKRLSSPLYIPGLPLSPIWHEFIILSFIILVGLLLAYILANNIAKPIKLLGDAMNRLASGDFETRISQQMYDRGDELSHLAQQFDKMAKQLQKFVTRERHLLHHVSHEMRSPLARIQAILGLIQAQPQKQDLYLQRLENELTRMDTLVGELLTLSRLETSNIPLEKEQFDLVPLLTQLVEDCQTIAQQNHQEVKLTLEKVPAKVEIFANESYLYRAFDNVIRNAMKYSPEGSTIIVSLRQDSKHWLIDVTDDGPGVDEMQLPHIFTAFYRADSGSHKPGTGLGLALAKHIVGQHRGKILAENVKPNGLCISFMLPKKQRIDHVTTLSH